MGEDPEAMPVEAEDNPAEEAPASEKVGDVKFVKVCPSCGSTDLKRHKSDPLNYAYGAGAQKYICQNCKRRVSAVEVDEAHKPEVQAPKAKFQLPGEFEVGTIGVVLVILFAALGFLYMYKRTGSNLYLILSIPFVLGILLDMLFEMKNRLHK